MKSALLETVRRYTEHHKMTAGVTDTAIPGVSIVRAECPGGLVHAIYKPLVCLILQGGKRVAMGSRMLQFAAGGLADRDSRYAHHQPDYARQPSGTLSRGS